MAKAATHVTVIIINYKGKDDLDELFTTLREQTYTDYDVLFIDNNSQDGSLEHMARHFPEVPVVAQPKNLGYARAANWGVRQTRAEHVVFLNTDIKLDPDCLQELVRVADSFPDVAVVASKMRLYHEPDVLNGVGGAMNYLGYTWDRGMFEPDNGQYDQVDEVIFACGGAALFRRKPFLYAGGYDLGFYMYHEDVDLCWRLWLLGYRVLTAPQAVVYHHFSRSTRSSRGMNWRELIGERNNIRAQLKNYQLKTLRRTLKELRELPQKPERKAQQRRNFRYNWLRLPSILWRRLRIQLRRKRSDEDLFRLIDSRPDVPVVVSGFSQGDKVMASEAPPPV